MERTRSRCPESAGEFRDRIFKQFQKITRASQSKLGQACLVVQEVWDKEELLSEALRTTLIAQLRFHIKDSRKKLARLEKLLVNLAGKPTIKDRPLVRPKAISCSISAEIPRNITTQPSLSHKPFAGKL